MLFALGQDRSPTAPFAPIPFVSGPSTKRLKVGFDLKNYYGDLPDPKVQRGIEQMAKVCEDLGHDVFEASNPVGSEFELRFNQIFGFRMVGLADAATAKAGRPPSETGMLDAFVSDWAEFARNFTPEDVAEANAYFLKLETDYTTWMSNMDVFLSPVTQGTAPRLGTLYDPDVSFDEMFSRIAGFASFTAVQNAIGLPGMSVPAGLSDTGLPVGSHFVAPAGREDLLLALAYEIELAQPWRELWAPVSLASI